MALFLIKTISSHELEYVVDAETKEQAEQAVKDGNYDYEFYQHHLGESILSSKQVTDQEYLQVFRQVNPEWNNWSDDFVLAKVNKA